MSTFYKAMAEGWVKGQLYPWIKSLCADLDAILADTLAALADRTGLVTLANELRTDHATFKEAARSTQLTQTRCTIGMGARGSSVAIAQSAIATIAANGTCFACCTFQYKYDGYIRQMATATNFWSLSDATGAPGSIGNGIPFMWLALGIAPGGGTAAAQWGATAGTNAGLAAQPVSTGTTIVWCSLILITAAATVITPGAWDIDAASITRYDISHLNSDISLPPATIDAEVAATTTRTIAARTATYAD